METSPHFINGVHAFTGQGLEQPVPIAASRYTVPADKRSQPIYFRGGNSSAEMIAVSLCKDGKAIRTFPIGAKGAVHIPLAVVEDLYPESVVELVVAAPLGTTGQLVLDVGFLEI